MADKESKLNLRVTASNEAETPLRGVAEAMGSIRQATNELSSVLGDISKSMRSLGDASTNMSRSVGEASSSMSGVSSASAEMSNAMSRDESVFKGMSATIGGLETSIKDLTLSMDGVSRGFETMSSNTKENETSARSFNEAIGGAGLLFGLQMIGSSMGHIGELGSDIFKEAIKSSADFEASLSQIATTLFIQGNTMEKSKELSEEAGKKALELGSHYHRSANEVSAAMSSLIKNGVDFQAVQDSLAQSTIQVSLLTGQSADDTAAVMSDIYNEYRDTFERNGKSMTQNMGDVTKYLTGAMYESRTTMDQFMTTMKYTGSVASLSGMDIKDLSVIIAELGRAGFQGSMSGTGLRAMFTSLIAPTEKASEELKKLGIIQNGNNRLIDESTGKMKPWIEVQGMMHDALAKLPPAQQLVAEKAIFGQQHFSKLAKVFEGTTDETKKMQEQFANIDIEKAVGIQMDNLSGDMMLLHANMQTLFKSLGETLHPIMRSIVQAIDSLVQKFQALSPGIKEAIMITLGLGSALAVVGGAMLTFLSTLGFISMGLKGLETLNPFKLLARSAAEATVATEGLAIAQSEVAAASEAGAIGGLAGMFGKLGGSLRSVGTVMSTLMFGPWKLMGNGLKSLPKLIAGLSFEKLFVGLLSPFKNIPIVLNGIVKAVSSTAIFIETIGPRIFSAIRLAFSWKGIITIARTALAALTGPWGILIFAIAAGVGAIIANWDTIKTWVQKHFGSTIPLTWSGLKDKAVAIFSELRTFFAEVWQRIRGVITEVWDYIRPFVMGAIEKLAAYWHEIWPELRQVFIAAWTAMKVLLAPILAVIGTAIVLALGFIKGAWHDAWNAIKDALKLVFDLIVDIIRTAFDIVSGIFKIALDILTGHWADAWNDMKSLLGNLWNDIKKLFGDFVQNALNFGHDFVMAVAHGIEGAIDAVIAAASKVVNAIKSIFSKAPKAPSVPSADPVQQAANAVPQFATGAVVNKPTLALIGEGGEEEYVIPKSKLQSQGGYGALPATLPFSGSNSRGGLHLRDINVQVIGVGKDGKQIGTDIASSIRQQLSFAI